MISYKYARQSTLFITYAFNVSLVNWTLILFDMFKTIFRVKLLSNFITKSINDLSSSTETIERIGKSSTCPVSYNIANCLMMLADSSLYSCTSENSDHQENDSVK